MILIVGSGAGAHFGLQHLLAAHGLRADEIETACRILDLTHPDAAELLVSAVRRAIGVRECYERLTAREREVLSLIVSGLLNKQVASRLGISQVTVEIHRSRVMQKMRASSFADLVRITSVISAA
jgi:DNA-binding NarL/FixJ family response regulator